MNISKLFMACESLTIVIPVFNRRELIGGTLDSLMRSEVLPAEVIVVDNGSSDGTYEWCVEYAEGHAGVRVLKEMTRGAAAARNRGLSECSTEWVYFFDSDDEFDGRFVGNFESLEMAGKDIVVFTTNMEVNGKRYVRATKHVTAPSVQILNSMLNTVSVAFRTDFIRSIGGWDNRCDIWDDWELGVRALLHRPKILWNTDTPFHCIHVHGDSITGSSFCLRYERIINVMGIVADFPDVPMDAMYLRSRIHIGKMRQEGRAKLCTKDECDLAVGAMREFVRKRFAPSWWMRLVGGALEWYSAVGGRSAWRMAVFVCPR